MRTPTPHTIVRSLSALAVVTMASCSLPSPQDWRQIQSDGLIPYVMNKSHSEHGSAVTAPTQQVAQVKSHPAPSVAPVDQSAPVSSTPSVPPPSQLKSDTLVTAQAVPGLAGYVRSPFTNPPRLVDVRGMVPGSKVVCPYTRKPFIVPNMPQDQQVASNPAPAPLPKPQPQATQPAPAPAPKVTQQVPTTPTKVAVNTAPAPQPPPTPQAKQTPAVQQTPPPATTELPFGIAIPGRPGFVNSPYAAKHQLVDVTGLPTGMEVKCPYTGKLFRVPPQASGAAPAKN